MGTRGAYGFQKNGVKKMTYNHWDSYPSGLGKDLTKTLRETSIEEWQAIFDRIEMVNDNVEATDAQIEACRQYADTSKSSGQLSEWYVLLRNTQGTLEPYKNGLTYMIEGGAEFMEDTLFCEWAYLINLDNHTFEVYESTLEPIVTFPLDAIPENWYDKFK